ncbi:MAG TPA: cation-translocating P-type ATPase C-terminal domain-containing protein, partial [Promineifilum sp.]
MLMAIFTLFVEYRYEPASASLAATMGFVVFSLLNVTLGLTSRSETASAFNRTVLQNRHQLGLYVLALLMVLLPTVLDFLQRFLSFESLSLDHWLICIGLAVALLLVDEVIKFFMRRNLSEARQS